MLTYLDSSALVKLVVEEAESQALEAMLRAAVITSSRLSDVEVTRAASRRGGAVVARARSVIGRVALIPLDEGIFVQARSVRPAALRSLDAIHLASALAIREQIEVLITYDGRMAEAAVSLGLRTTAPR